MIPILFSHDREGSLHGSFFGLLFFITVLAAVMRRLVQRFHNLQRCLVLGLNFI